APLVSGSFVSSGGRANPTAALTVRSRQKYSRWPTRLAKLSGPHARRATARQYPSSADFRWRTMAQLALFSLDGRVALVSGGGGAIGSALAEGLAAAGARVAVSGRTPESCEAAVERVRSAGSEGLA